MSQKSSAYRLIMALPNATHTLTLRIDIIKAPDLSSSAFCLEMISIDY